MSVVAGTRIGTFVVSDRIWQNQSEFLRERNWLTRIHRITWDKDRYWITAESALFDPIKTGEVIPDYEIEVDRHKNRRDFVRAKRITINLAAA